MTSATPDADLTATREALATAMQGTVGVRHPKDDVLDHARQAALDAAKVLAGPDGALDPDAFTQLEEDLPADLRAWLLELPSFLSKKGREDQGDQLCDVYAPLLGEAYLEVERAIVRLEAGRKEDAVTVLERCQEQFGDHTWVLLRGGFLKERVGRGREARKDYQQALEAARESGDRKDLRFAYDALIQHHQEHNESGEALALSKQMMEDLPEIEEEFRTETIVNEAPKVGRNDLCPCGSGKKFKKCCGR